MDTPLVTSDGFPRSDIDVAQIREARSRIIRLKNDLRGIMSQIEAGLVEYFKQAKDKGTSDIPQIASSSSSSKQSGLSSETNSTSGVNTGSSTASEATRSNAPKPPSIPFARVNSVEPNSPADSSGLLPGDQVVSFGSVNVTNHQNLSRIAQTVQANEGVSDSTVLFLDSILSIMLMQFKTKY
ncbi:Nas2p [Sugiyamaella lignohabitans]|uniref:Nas2p n=1 Tax=Sugiyamaella lignohabitans TaxID=796027 RepID=A0A167DIF8_9ASCO|nr:Nas2p [Sugiyamaella lignohabitans]ANB12952.1 Nas2p [Sugiyamaella lignohabitans]